MTMNITFQLILLIFLLIVSAFFSASETSMMSLSKIRVRYMVEEEIKGAKLIQSLVEKPDKLISGVLVGNNIANIAGSALATSLMMEFFAGNAVAIATIIMTILILVFSEITPKSLAAQNAEKVALMVVKPLSFIITILSPIVVIFTKVTNVLIRILGGKRREDAPFITEEELKSMVNVSHEEGVLEIEEKQMIYNVFEFGDLRIKDIMVQRTDISAIDKSSDFNKIMEIIKEEKYSRYPIYEDSIDNIVGILSVKDFIYGDHIKEEFDISLYMREPYFTYEFKKITELFKEIRKNRNHMVVVVDEYGGTAGIVTIEDVIEEIVGEIEDEYDEVEKEVEKISDTEYLIDGSTKIGFISGFLNMTMESDDFDSLGGFIMNELGRLPIVGESILYEDMKFTVESICNHRIQKIRVQILSE
ncbi:hemolysin family protein [Alkaliphilus oremlandii]|nr:hemolysin family protein [Alkaliphilus oremlandii]